MINTAVQTDCFVRQIEGHFFLKVQFQQFFCGFVCVAEYDGVRVDFPILFIIFNLLRILLKRVRLFRN